MASDGRDGRGDRPGAAVVRAVVAVWRGTPAARGRGARGRLAAHLRTTVRSLWNAEHRPAAPRGPGRPPHPAAERRRVHDLVAPEWRRQGADVGWRRIVAALRDQGHAVPVRLVQAALATLKRAARVAEARSRAAARVTVHVEARDVIWAQDSVHLGWVGDAEVCGEVARDRATLATVTASAGPPATADDVCAGLEAARLARDGLPLVVQTDNGPPYVSRRLATYLAHHRVVHLRSRPYLPQDNGAAERAIGEYRGETGLTAGGALASVREAQARLDAARGRLDTARVRTSRGNRTAVALDAIVPHWYPRVDRERFYAASQAAMAEARAGAPSARAARAAEREAIWRTLEAFGLARRTRGGQPPPVAAAAGPARGLTTKGTPAALGASAGQAVSTTRSVQCR